MRKQILTYQKRLFLISLFFAPFFTYSQLLLEADGPGNTYELITSALAPGYDTATCEVPDVFHPSFGRHIAEVWDADLSKYVFEFYAHASIPNELQDWVTTDVDRQRNEIKTYNQSPDSLKGLTGKMLTCKWQFKVPVGFQPSPNFTHLHQIKGVDGDESNPLFTLTPRYGSSGNKLELVYIDGHNLSTKLSIVDLALFEGNWVEATEKIKVDSLHGTYSIQIKNVTTGAVIMSYNNSDLCTIRSTNSFIRPKWGIYRNITQLSYLRDEAVRFAGFFIQQGEEQVITLTETAKSYGIPDFSPATVTSNLPITYTSSNPLVATVVGGKIHTVGIGTTTITASQPGDSYYRKAADVSNTLTITKSTQTISFPSIPPKGSNEPDFTPTAVSSVGLELSFSSSNPAVATIVGKLVHIVGMGTTIITASQAGDANAFAATNVSQTLTVISPTQSIVFAALPTKALGDIDFDPAATINSGLTINYSSSNTDVATIVNGFIHIVGVGSTTITASQPGNLSFSAAPTVDQVFTVTNKAYTLNSVADAYVFGGSVNTNYGAGVNFQLKKSGTTTTVLRKSYLKFDLSTLSSSSNIVGAKVRLYASSFNGGTSGVLPVLVRLSQVTDDSWNETTLNYSNAPLDGLPIDTVVVTSSNPMYYEWDVTSFVKSQVSGDKIVSLLIDDASAAGSNYIIGFSSKESAANIPELVLVQSAQITFPTLPVKEEGALDFSPGATASTGLTVNYTTSNPSVATIVNGYIHVVGVGTTLITATQAGDLTNNAAPSVSRLLTVKSAKKPQTISFDSLPAITFGAPDFNVVATATSGLNVSFASSNSSVATIINGKIHFVGAGEATITALQAGDSTYLAAEATRLLTVNKSDQTILLPTLPLKKSTDSDFSTAATASSGLDVSLVSSNLAVATIVNGFIHIVGPGTTTITASQTGNSNYYAAPDVSASLNITGILMDELFAYSISNLANESSWITAGTLTTGTGRNLAPSALNYTDANGSYALSGLGKTMNSDITSTTDYKSYKSFGAAVSTGAIYLTFMFQAGVLQTQTASALFGLSSATNAGPQVWIGKGLASATSFRFGTTRGITTSSAIQWDSTEYASISAVFLLVLKYDFTAQTSSIFINPPLGTLVEPIPAIIDNSTATIRTALDNLWLRSNGVSNSKFSLGGARVAIDWADAVAIAPIQTAVESQTPVEKITLSVTKNKMINCSQIGDLEIYNLQGELMLCAKNVNSLTTNLSAGFYIVHFTNKGGQHAMQKIMIL